MPDAKRKTRLLSFRLSEEQYELLRNTSMTEGAASVSDFARSLLTRLMSGGVDFPGHPFHAELNKLGGNIQEVSRELRRLMDLLETQKEKSASQE